MKLRFFLVCLMLAGCSGAGEDSPDIAVDMATELAATEVQADTTSEVVLEPDKPDRFTISISESRGVDSQSGFAYGTAGFAPATGEKHGYVLTSGDCYFHRPDLPQNCDPPCQPGTVCSYVTGSCHPPLPHWSAGTIVVEGLDVGLTIAPETRYHYYLPVFTPEPEDGEIFSADSVITASAPGDDVPEFTITGSGVANVVTTLPCPQGATAGTDLVVTWEASNGGADLRFSMQSANHGAHFSSIHCLSADDGEITVDAALIDLYLAEQRPVEAWQLSRFATTTIVLQDTTVEMTVSSSVSCSY